LDIHDQKKGGGVGEERKGQIWQGGIKDPGTSSRRTVTLGRGPGVTGGGDETNTMSLGISRGTGEGGEVIFWLGDTV